MNNNASSASPPTKTTGNTTQKSPLSSPRLNLLLWQKDPSLRYQWWLIAFACFTTCLILLAMTALSGSLYNARTLIKAEITVQIPTLQRGYRTDGKDPLVEQVGNLLDTVPEISGVRLLSIEEVRDILRPWIGDEVELQGLPVPYVIAVQKRAKNTNDAFDLATLKAQLNSINPNIVVDDHSKTLEDILRLERTARYASILSLIVGSLMLSTIAIIAVNVALHLQRHVLDVLFLAGASDAFLADQFTLIGLSMTLRGLFVGAGAALLVYNLSLPLLHLKHLGGPWVGLMLGQFLALTLVSIVVLVCSGLSTRLTVQRRLKQIY